ncbi:MAG: hypothetical protein GWP08_06475 [Nitrospiraceae bacterium]|nr:hypothetical protein [Nitrospiraceae bacterium]
MRRVQIETVVILLVVLTALSMFPSHAQQLSERKVERVRAALPDAAIVQPQSPRKLLVYTACRGYVHASIPVGAKMLELMGEKTGAFEAVVTDDPAMFEPDNLAQFDAVCMNNTTGPVFMPEGYEKLSQEEQAAARERDAALKASLLAFVKGGKGLVGIHAATDCLYEWPDYGEMIGGYFDGHPWSSGDTVGVRLDDPAHPLNAGFKGRKFRIRDEIYQIRDPYSRDRLRVLLTIDPQNSDMTKNGMKREDGDYAISWVQSYGSGRVFYCSLGHNESVYWNPGVLSHYLAGIQFALGDLPVDTTPSAQLPAEYFKQSRRELAGALLEETVAEIATFEFGQSPEWLETMSMLVVESQDDPARRSELAAQLTTILDSKATLAAKQYVCRELWRIASKAEVPALAALLEDDETADMARYALERMEDPAAGDALRKALKSAEGATLVGIVNSLGERKDARATKTLARLTRDSDAAVAGAAVRALGKIGTKKAAAALKKAKSAGRVELSAAIDAALLSCADALSSESIYEGMLATSESPQTRAAALKGLALLRGAQGVDLVLTGLADAEPIVRNAAADTLRTMDAPGIAAALTAALPGLDPNAQALLLSALADRGDAAALPAVTRMLTADDPQIQLAAMSALVKIGDGAAVIPLALMAAGGDKEMAKSARNTLNRLPGDDVNTAIIGALDGALDSAPPELRVTLVRCLAGRFAFDSVPTLLKTVTDPDANVRAQSFKTLRVLATPKELPVLVDLMVAETDERAQSEAESAVVTIAKKVEDASQRSACALAAFANTRDNIPGRCALVRVLGELGDDSTLDPLRADLKSDNAQLREAAIRALSEWPSAAPLPDLYEVAKNGPTPALRAIALRAYFRLLTQPSDRPGSETVKMYERGLGLAKTADAKRMAIAGLANVPDKGALRLLRRLQKDPELKAEADQAIERVQNRGHAVSASHNSQAASRAIDGDPATRWDTGTAQSPGQWFMVDLGWESEVRGVFLDTTGSAGDYPRGYAIYVSNSTEDWGEPVAQGEPDGPVNKIACARKRGRYVRIVQTEAKTSLWWSIHEMRIDSNL